MKYNLKPAVVPTLLSSKGTLWCALLVGYFLALLGAYNLRDKIVAANARLARPVDTTVETEYCTVRLPVGWQEYATEGGIVEMRRRPGERLPFVQVVASCKDEYAYRALDCSAPVVTQRYEDIAKKALGPEMEVEDIGSEVILSRPGVNALHSYLEVGPSNAGEAVIFYMGDVRYLVLAVYAKTDAASRTEIADFFAMLPKTMQMPDWRECIERPVIDSLHVTVEASVAAHVVAEREIALWKLFSGRARTQPELYVKPAIEHYRKAIRELASVREERDLLRGEDFQEYRKFLVQRKDMVREWFVRLEKEIGMRNNEAAKSQAQYIIDNATLVDESLDKRRAAELLASIVPPQK